MTTARPRADRTSIVPFDAMMAGVGAIETALLVLKIWTTPDGIWHEQFNDPLPAVVDETDACRLERIWPARESAYMLTITAPLGGEYVHVLFGRRPRPSDVWAVIALVSLKMELMVGALETAPRVH